VKNPIHPPPLGILVVLSTGAATAPLVPGGGGGTIGNIADGDVLVARADELLASDEPPISFPLVP
jgi:hypothetical protein